MLQDVDVPVGLYPLLVIFYGVASSIAFIVFALDKQAAIHGSSRVAESRLHLLSLLCGWPGAWLAQRLLRHKTQKRRFQRAFLSMAVINCLLLGCVVYLLR